MTGSTKISRSHVVFGICLPIAILLGYILAEPAEVSSYLFMALIIGVVSIPMVMKWHQLLLIFSCNAVVYPYFLPGKPPLWLIASAVSFFMLILGKSLGETIDFFKLKRLSQSLIFLAVVICATAYANGIGFQSMGGGEGGGKRYVMILGAIATYFCLSAMEIPHEKVFRNLCIFFLSSFTSLMGYLALLTGPTIAMYLYLLFPVDQEYYQSSSVSADVTGATFSRFGSLSGAALGLVGLMLALYGIRGVFELRKPWRLFVFVLAIAAAFFSGFRSCLIMVSCICLFVFLLEGLLKSWYTVWLAIFAVVGMLLLVEYSDRLPLSVQRTVCFLPIKVDFNVRASAEASTQWRIDLWQQVIPTIPQYLIKGHGLGVSQKDIDLDEQAMEFGTFVKSYEFYIATGDYHNGPLSILIPFGIFGILGFAWFCWCSISLLRRNFLYGDPALRTVNTFLLAYFLAQLVCFCFVFGSFYSGFINFTCIAGLSAALNRGVALAPVPAPVAFGFRGLRKVTI